MGTILEEWSDKKYEIEDREEISEIILFRQDIENEKNHGTESVFSCKYLYKIKYSIKDFQTLCLPGEVMLFMTALTMLLCQGAYDSVN